MAKIHVATRKGLFTLQPSARSAPGRWSIARTAFLGEPVSMLLEDPRDHAIYAALHLGHFGAKLHRSDDGGKTFTEITTPSYKDAPPMTARPDAGFARPGEDPDKPSLKMIWIMEPGGADQPGRIWCGTLPGGLFRSDDRGATWQLNLGLWNRPERAGWFGGGADYPGIHSICIDPRNSRHITIGSSCGGVWHSQDDGHTWELRSNGMFANYMPPDRKNDLNIQDLHRLVQCAAAPECMWVQHHNGIFCSRDRGKTFASVDEAGPSTFGFAVAVHPRDPQTAWFVPAASDQRRVPVQEKVAVTRTRDGGRSFQTLTKGLPQDQAFHIFFRHAFEVAADGATLAMGSTTGSLWISADQGDSFTRLTAELPPIYAVRFA